MKIVFASLVIFLLTPLAMPRVSKEKVITYHIEIKNWPESLKPMVDRVVQQLTGPNQCWSFNDKSKVSFTIEAGADVTCSTFVIFEDDKKLVTQKKDHNAVKYVISHDGSKKGQGKMLLKLFRGNGKKLTSAASTSFGLKDETDDTLLNRIVLWSLK